MENEKDDIQKTKLNENGTLCIGQKDSQKDLDLFPKKSRIGVDKTETIVYNTSMKNNDTFNERKNIMTKLYTKENYFGFNPELFNKTATHIYNGVKVRVYKTYDLTGCATILEGPNKGKATTVYFDKAVKITE